MIAFILSFVFLTYILIPGVLFRSVSSVFLPLTKFQRTKTEEITFAVLSALLPFLLAITLIWTVNWIGSHPFYFNDTVLQRRSDYKMIFAASYSEELFRNNQGEFWRAITRTLRRQGRMLTWYYLLLVGEAMLFGLLSRSFGRLYRNRLYAWIFTKILPTTISEWHVLLTPFSFPPEPRRQVMVDVLTSDDHLYRGEIGDYFLDTEGKLSGIFLVETYRFDRQGYLQAKSTGRTRPTEDYWKKIPGAKLYIFADRITTLNISYEPAAALPEFIREVLEKLDIPARVTVEDTSPPVPRPTRRSAKPRKR
jgi:hypothetical protein